jgi:hypothetical protein
LCVSCTHIWIYELLYFAHLPDRIDRQTGGQTDRQGDSSTERKRAGQGKANEMRNAVLGVLEVARVTPLTV